MRVIIILMCCSAIAAGAAFLLQSPADDEAVPVIDETPVGLRARTEPSKSSLPAAIQLVATDRIGSDMTCRFVLSGGEPGRFRVDLPPVLGSLSSTSRVDPRPMHRPGAVYSKFGEPSEISLTVSALTSEGEAALVRIELACKTGGTVGKVAATYENPDVKTPSDLFEVHGQVADDISSQLLIARIDGVSIRIVRDAE